MRRTLIASGMKESSGKATRAASESEEGHERDGEGEGGKEERDHSARHASSKGG